MIYSNSWQVIHKRHQKKADGYNDQNIRFKNQDEDTNPNKLVYNE